MIRLDRKEIEKYTSDFRKHRETKWNQLTRGEMLKQRTEAMNERGEERWKWTELYPKAMWPAKSVLKLMKQAGEFIQQQVARDPRHWNAFIVTRYKGATRCCFESDLWIAVWTS